MKKQFHILNGDALKEQFPKQLQGDFMVARECLVDGSVEGEDLTQLYRTRAQFLSEHYEGCTTKGYYENTVSEFQKIEDLTSDYDLNLWFEDDLFCQVNLWFVLNLIANNYKNQSIFLVRPKITCPYNFGAMTKEELESAFQNKTSIEFSELTELSNLWPLYQKNDGYKMLQISEKLNPKFPFLLPAINAHRDRLPKNGELGRPTQALIQIMEELQTTEFVPIFRAFWEREGIYGFGDSQVKRIYDELLQGR